MKASHVGACCRGASIYNLAPVCMFCLTLRLDGVIANDFGVLHFSIKWFFIIVYLENSK